MFNRQGLVTILYVLMTFPIVFGATVIRHCARPQTAALTFDDGPYQYTRHALDLLDRARAKGTFFVNGQNWGCIYDQTNADTLLEIYSRGHQVASHTWHHRDLTTLSASQVNQEVRDTQVAIERITGATPAYMRPPYGNYNDRVLAAADNNGLTGVVIWDFDSGDSTGASVNQQTGAYRDLASRRPSNILSLQHDVHRSSVYDVLPEAIRQLQGAGYQLVTLAECLGTNPYQREGRPSSRNGDWHC